MERLFGYYKELKLSGNWIKNGISITHGTTPKLREITGIIEKKMTMKEMKIKKK